MFDELDCLKWSDKEVIALPTDQGDQIIVDHCFSPKSIFIPFKKMVVCTIFLSLDCWTLYSYWSRESKQYGLPWIIQQHLYNSTYFLRAISPFLRWRRLPTIVWLPVNPLEWVEQGLKSEYPRRRVAVFSPQAGDPQSIMSWYFQHHSAAAVVTQPWTSNLAGDSTRRVLI